MKFGEIPKGMIADSKEKFTSIFRKGQRSEEKPVMKI